MASTVRAHAPPPPRGPGSCWRRRADHAHCGHGRPGGGCDAAPGRAGGPRWPGRRGHGRLAWCQPPGPGPAPAPSFRCSCWTRDSSGRSIYRSASSAETRSPSTTAGQIAGSYYDDPAATCLRGFLRDRNGRFTRIDFPTPGTTQQLDINDRGRIAGSDRPSAGGACSDTVPLRGFHRPCVPVSLTRSVCRAGLGEAEPDGPDLIPANRTGAQMRESWRSGGDTLRRSGRLEANLPHISHTRSSSRLHRAGVA
jgi:hypothetical protein